MSALAAPHQEQEGLTESLRKCACGTLFQAVRDLEVDLQEPIFWEGSHTTPADRQLALQAHARYRHALNNRLSAMLWLSGAWENEANISCETALNSARVHAPDLPLTRTGFFAWALALESRGLVGATFASVAMVTEGCMAEEEGRAPDDNMDECVPLRSECDA